MRSPFGPDDPIATPLVQPRGFGHLYTPNGKARGGLVIVQPFGFEAISARRSMRHLAKVAARAGLSAAVLDLPGTGDATGTDLDPGLVDRWLDCILAARGHLLTERVVLCGVRLGALLAIAAASRSTDVAAVIAIAPLLSGRAFLREGKLLQAALGLEPAPPGRETPEDIHELVGFALTAETRSKLGELDAMKLLLPAKDMLVIDRDDMPANDKWVARLRELGAHVDHQRLPGYVEMVLDPHRAIVPHAIIDATVSFAARVVSPGSEVNPRSAEPVAVRPRSPLEGKSLVSYPSTFTGVVEDPADVDGMHGIYTHKRGAPASGRALLLINAGSVGHIGPNRLYVELARRLAERGDQVLRLDLSGLGDSEPRRGCEENIVYADHHVDDVGRAVAWLRHRPGVKHVAVAGLCSGAYHAFKAAVAGHAIDTVIPINPLLFFWKPGMPLDSAAYKVAADAKRWGQNIRSSSSWKKVLRGEVDLVRVGKVMARRIRHRLEHRARDVLRRFVTLPGDVGSELLALDKRGVRMQFIFAASDPGEGLLREEGGAAVTQLSLSGTLGIQVIDGPDHTFTPRWSHPLLLDAIESALP